MFEKLKLENILAKQGFSHWGTTRLERPLSIDLYKDWLNEGLAGSMEYLKLHFPQKERPELLAPEAQSAIVIAKNYLPHPYPEASYPFESQNIAKYARGCDYHLAFQQELVDVIHLLKESYPDEHFVSFTDSAPVLERDLAFRAGLGWFGKNTCIIDRKKGSYFLIGEIYTSLRLEEGERVQDFCGSCTRCMEACPTEAITEERKLDARKCISYLTIESNKIPETQLRSKMGTQLFGCDICQDVCPWNRKHKKEEPLNNQEKLIKDLKYILSHSNKALQKKLAKTALSRSAGFKLKRNAIIVIANGGLNQLTPEVQKYQDHPRLSELANWCLSRLNG